MATIANIRKDHRLEDGGIRISGPSLRSPSARLISVVCRLMQDRLAAELLWGISVLGWIFLLDWSNPYLCMVGRH